MQLRVARLCLDCEELHVDNRCPRCASARYAFLSNWLPSEERRRWRRARTETPQAARGVRGFIDALARWHRGESAEPMESPLTRASDHIAALHFDAPAPEHREPAALDPLSKHDPLAKPRT